MVDIMLEENATDGDLNFSAGSLVVIDDRATETGQRILARIKTVKGEWFLDINFGFDYKNYIWNKQTSVQVRDARIQEQILLSSGAGSKFLKYNTELDTTTRTLSVEADVQDLDGTVTNISLSL